MSTTNRTETVEQRNGVFQRPYPYMPYLWHPNTEKVLSCHISDVHFSFDPPSGRAEKDGFKGEGWFEYMEYQFSKLLAFMKSGSVPILTISGDLFHHYKMPPELVNFVINIFQKYKEAGITIYAVPGQHDLPHHNLTDVHKSAYSTLVQTGLIKDVSFKNMFHHVDTKTIEIKGRAWKADHLFAQSSSKPNINTTVGLYHAYCYSEQDKRGGFPNVDQKSEVKSIAKAVDNDGVGYAFFGDNHLPLYYKSDFLPCIYNCGAFLKRKTDDEPETFIGLLCLDKTDSRVYLRCHKLAEEAPIRGKQAKDKIPQYLEVIEGFRSLGVDVLDFAALLLRDLNDENNDLDDDIREYLLGKLDQVISKVSK